MPLRNRSAPPSTPIAASQQTYEFRCPIHGFIKVNDWERSVIDDPVFQRLRRIRQLGWTDYIYPGSTHTRFEHSLGVMHVATRLYDSISQRSRTVLESRLGYNVTGTDRDRQLVRFAALLHDTGHAPFSHAAEELLPNRAGTNQKYSHEDYSAEIIRRRLRHAIESHPANDNMGLTAELIASLIDGTSREPRMLFWRELLDGQMDADRMDYLLRDSLHLGVQYGTYDLDRIVATATAVQMSPEGSDNNVECRLAVAKGGLHAAVGLILARYFMFTQVYFHKTRIAYDIHLRKALAHMLQDGVFPSPDGDEIDEYLQWDDWRVLGRLAADEGGEHGRRLRARDHFRQVWESPESPMADAQADLDRLREALGALLVAEERSEKSWYKTGTPDIQVMTENSGEVRPLSDYSPVIKQLKEAPHRQVRLYSLPKDAAKGRQIVREKLGGTS